MDLLLLFIPRLSVNVWNENGDIKKKIELIEKILNVREKEVTNFKKFFSNIQTICGFLLKSDIKILGNTFSLTLLIE